MTEENDDIASEVRAAFESAEVEEPVVETTTEERSRDEQGKFVANAEDTPVEAAARLEPQAPVPKEEPTGTTLSIDRAPSSWTPAAREKWGEIPQELRSEIIRREEASIHGVRQIQERFAPAEQFLRAIDPIVNEARSLGASPDQYIQSLAISERTLRTADMPSKFNELMRIADQYGIPLRDVINKSVGQEVIKAPQQQQAQLPPEIAREISEIRQWRATMEQEQAVSMVESFGADKDFFNDVRGTMADLIERGMAKNIQDAYDQACWMNPGVREVMLARVKGDATTTKVTQRRQAAAGASIPASGRVDVEADDDDSDYIADLVRKEFNRAYSSRE